MRTTKFTYWQDGNYYLGFLNDYPDYQTQAATKEELVHNLKDLLADIESGEVPGSYGFTSTKSNPKLAMHYAVTDGLLAAIFR